MHKKFSFQGFPPNIMERRTHFVAGVAAIFFPLAVLHAAETGVGVDNLVITVGATTYRIPHLVIEGATLPAGELARIFEGDEKAVDARLVNFSARKIVVPALAAETRIGATVQRSAYRDLSLEHIVAGRVGSARAAGAEQTLEKPDGGVERYVLGAMTSKGVDLRQMAHLALAAGTDANEPRKPLLDEEVVESSTFENKRENLVVKTGRLTLTGAKARALPTPPTQLFERLEKFEPEKTGADTALLRELVDAFAAFEVASLDARDIVVTGKGEPADKPFTVKVGRAFANGIAAATVGELAVEDFSLASSDGGRVSLKRFALRDARLDSLTDSAYPRVGRIEAKGLDADLPDPKAGDASRMKFRLEGASADFTNFREMAPTKAAARVDRLAVDLAARGDALSAAQFIALGYRDLDISAAVAGEWNEKTQEAVVAPVRLEGRDMGAATLKITFGNVSSAVFSSMRIVSRAAALTASVKGVDLTLEGGGLIDRILALEAKEQKTSIELARADYAKTAGTAIVALAGGGEKAMRIGAAVAAYIMKPKRLHLRLTSERGVNALDALARKPGEILENVEVEATAER